eukprot:TRINITY_DN2107_c0_g2_i1.p3 TRINITY_DN2107_c0_g2~~TRINITY_DN2107_c0_g2_i1.p3  ORF type:complete len:159 (+),score=41.12 TRINITY_DN2107_c0_g2_i1:96-572(+)
METFPRSPLIQATCCQLIARIAVVDAAKMAVIDKGGFTSIVACMKNFPDSKQVEQFALAALFGLGVDAKAWVDAGVPNVVVTAMRHRMDEVQALVYSIQWFLAVADAENGRYIRRSTIASLWNGSWRQWIATPRRSASKCSAAASSLRWQAKRICDSG